jgi:hypothetical protein
MMIGQSNLRMDDPLSELRKGVAELGNICLSHQYQFGKPVINYQTSQETGGKTTYQTNTINKKILRRGINLKMRGVTVVNNPDAEMQRLIQLYQVLITEPSFAQNQTARIEVLRDALRAGRVPGRQRYLPSAEEVQKMEIELRKQAMQQMEAEKQAQAVAQQEAMVKDNLSKAQQALTIKSVAERTAKAAMPVPEAVPAGVPA